MRGTDHHSRGAGRVAVARSLALLVLAATLSACGDVETAESGNSANLPANASIIRILSNRADLVSGDDVLVEIRVPEGVAAADLRMQLNGSDVTGQFAQTSEGNMQGLVTGLELGKNTITADWPGSNAEAEVINHPNGGPVFSGPQLQPWTCQEGALDEQCNQPPEYRFYYKSTNPLQNGLQPYDPASPAGDVAETTTDSGLSVPFIVREEIGYQGRDQYRIIVLFNPEEPWQPWAPQPQWNGKVFVPHGGNCGVDYGVGTAPTQDYAGTFDFIPAALPVSFGDSPSVALSRGFAVMSTALANTGHNCNVAVNAESLMMAKERLIENYGQIRYTIGTGCSGGSIAQQTVANAYPGIYQGLIVSCSYPDTASVGAQFFDYHLLRRYFEDPTRLGDGAIWTPLHWAAVEGHLLPVNAIVADEGLFKRAVDPKAGCGYIDATVGYHPDTNPAGVRCSIFDLMINMFGPRDPAVWTENEIMLGRGFGAIPIGNVGVEYGLESLRSGVITPAMFVDLNVKIGGLTVDAEPSEGRLVADQPALQNMYRGGWHNSASNLDTVAIIDHGGLDPGLAHDAHWAWSMRARLLREQGHHENQVIWFGQTPLIGDPNFSTEALLAMDRWLAAVETDLRDVPLADKIVHNRPGDLKDRCTAVSALSTPDGIALPLLQPTLDALLDPALDPVLGLLNEILNPVLGPLLTEVVDPLLETVCSAGAVGDLIRTEFSTPRGVAGQPRTYGDHVCQLKPLDRSDDYGPIGFTDSEWAQLQAAFPEGVCDYSKPGIGKQHTVTWQTYQDENGEVIYGGEALPDAPANSGTGWASPAFAIHAD